jgi:hypothetical protein
MVKIKKQLDKRILADPTKDFFISMLIKDITLKDAIGDLIDNSIDGAKRTAKTVNLSGYYVRITASKDEFEIKDNCGGIDINIARNYAFRFGRPSEYKIEKNLIGQFGIGMKRAFFKIGSDITVNSVSQNSEFIMPINVVEWQKLDKWDFELRSLRETRSPIPSSKWGTIINIKDLSNDAETSFGSNRFIQELIDEIAYEHLYSINKGLEIKINGSKIKPPSLKLIFDKNFKPAYWQHKFDNKLTVEVLCGVSEDKGDEGGWYIFCNERLITGPDTTALTGWTGRREGADGVAAYHDQFHRFRGYVFFNSPDASQLPWNTTKTGVDKDSQKYQFVKRKMIEMMKPTMTLMNSLKKEREKNKPKTEQPLSNKINNAKILDIESVLKRKASLTEVFIFPKEKKTKEKLGEGRISYSKPYTKIERIKKALHVTTLSEVGESTFDYFYKREIGS